MIMNRLHATMISSLFAAAAFSGAVHAAPPAPDQGAPDRGAMQGKHHERHGGDFKERAAARQAALHDKLKLTGNQEAAWKTYIAAATPPAPPARPDRAQWEKMSAPDRMERMMTMMKEREGNMASHLAAMKTFYATLSPLQQQIFNDNVGRGMGAHRHGHGHGRG
jgi:protein CpxP